jgi:hypothetical protein
VPAPFRGGAGHEHKSRLEAEKARDVWVWHLLDARVKQIDGVVVKLEATGNLVFQFTDALLKFDRRSIRLQGRIIFCDRKESSA